MADNSILFWVQDLGVDQALLSIAEACEKESELQNSDTDPHPDDWRKDADTIRSIIPKIINKQGERKGWD